MYPQSPLKGEYKTIKASSGGVFYVIYFLYAIYQGFYLPFFSIPISLIGLLDDQFNISKIRLGAQISAITVSILFYYQQNCFRYERNNNLIFIFLFFWAPL